jgi:hypothetical protein
VTTFDLWAELDISEELPNALYLICKLNAFVRAGSRNSQRLPDIPAPPGDEN